MDLTEVQKIDLACAWSDYRSAYGSEVDPLIQRRNYLYFQAGFEAALGEQHKSVMDG